MAAILREDFLETIHSALKAVAALYERRTFEDRLTRRRSELD
jgi:hypothetical protein